LELNQCNGSYFKMHVIIGVQCRSGSTRFPCKSLMDLQGRPMWKWSYDTCCKLAKTVMLIPENDDLMISSCRAHKAEFIVGHPTDLIARYGKMMDYYNRPYMVRVTADCPFVNEYLLSWVLQQRHDYLICQPVDGFDIEMCSRNLWSEVLYRSTEREHVFKWLWDNWDNIAGQGFDMVRQVPKFSIDTKEEFELINNLLGDINEFVV